MSSMLPALVTEASVVFVVAAAATTWFRTKVARDRAAVSASASSE